MNGKMGTSYNIPGFVCKISTVDYDRVICKNRFTVEIHCHLIITIAQTIGSLMQTVSNRGPATVGCCVITVVIKHECVTHIPTARSIEVI